MPKLTLPTESKMLQRDFIYGVATSSFQIEGARAARLPCIWDTFCRQPGAIVDGSHGDVACEHIARWQQDVELITNLGVDAYRLSIAWGRVMDEHGQPNQEGIRFYQNLVAALTAQGIKVFVTLYHWDLPQYLEDQGGWLNRQTAYAFAEYADVISQALGEQVYSYATLNEPFCSAYLGYEVGIHAPGKKGQRYGRQAAHHLLLAHGLAMQVLRRTVPSSECGIVLNFSTAYGASSSAADTHAAQLADQYHNLWYLQPLLEGRYPDVLALLPEDVRPEIGADDMAIISAKNDFIGINYYTRAVFASDGKGWFAQCEPTKTPLTAMGWEVVPEAFEKLLVDLHQRFSLPPLYITENGAAFDDQIVDGAIYDKPRIDYFNSHLNAVHNAIEQGVNIRGYFAWSLMDNFEWALGYSKRFGIVHVDYHTQQRTLKDSALAYKGLLENRL
ncbi:GH1 family beta-glucosidase [Pseudoalteromonas sp. Cnat2-41]|uniref:GH1 family beta-glucosidase n=1 Tax=unclassified Pseudoalteromonas TaxID=194690 RepID=UPI001EF87D39|nr:MULTISPECIES: GH1 family beta-glucosidase [unclassified Pseudoalteromonas]MCF2860816.1 GH1 family beta-glucosidase [Pseudoalteromonas sp. CNAT2-18]MCG7556685.1 GH1 family beta-glucosidase [Pseudoalteromonas sp. CNAT2-18.1]